MNEPIRDLTLVYTVFGSDEDAQRVAQMMVEKGFAACANILAPSESVYRWKGVVEKQREYPVLFKTSAAKHESLIDALSEAHPYALPAIAAWPAGTTPEYRAWVDDMTGGA